MRRLLSGEFISIGTLLILLSMATSCVKQSEKSGEEGVQLLEIGKEAMAMEQGFDEGVSGAFAGQVGEWLVWGGGCNFPSDHPSAKRFYQSIYATRASDKGEREVVALGTLAVPSGYGASLISTDGASLYLVGGTDGVSARKEIYRVSLVDGAPELELLPTALPFGWYEGGAALVGDTLYLAGGWRGEETGVEPLLRLTKVALSTGESSAMLPLPEGARIQPVLFNCCGSLYLFGGFRPANGEEPPYMQAKGYRLSLETQPLEWEEVANEPTVDLSNGARKLLFVGSAVSCDPSNGTVYLAGGVDWDIFQSALDREYREGQARRATEPDEQLLAQFDEARKAYLSQSPEAYRFMPALLKFNPQSDEWKVVAEEPAFATAGAVLSVKGGMAYLVGGELKPRLRTPNIWYLKIK